MVNNLLSFNNSLPRLKANIRFLHAAAGGPSIDIYANGNLLSKNISFANISNYNELSPGNYKMEMFKTGTYDTPLFSETVTLTPNSVLTVCIILDESNLEILKISDIFTSKNINDSHMRFINLSPNAPLLTLSLPNGITLFNGVEYLETTNYYLLSPGIYDFLLTATNDPSFRKFMRNVDLRKDLLHTIYIIGLTDVAPQLGYLYVTDGITK